MDIVDWTGFVGVSLILLAYFLNLKKMLETTSLPYILMNLSGAVLACTASVLMKSIPFIILEGVWTIVSVDALIQFIIRK